MWKVGLGAPENAVDLGSAEVPLEIHLLLLIAATDEEHLRDFGTKYRRGLPVARVPSGQEYTRARLILELS